MSEAVTTFFDAWQLESADERLEKISSAVAANIQYADPRTPDTVNGLNALSDYVGMFSANAPGWSATVKGCDTTAGMIRATVAFSGPGPDGKDSVMLGQYFVELESDLIVRMVGFVGTGAAD